MIKVVSSGSRRGYTGTVTARKIYFSVFACLLLVCLAQAQDPSAQQALKHAVELHQSGHYAEAITEYQAFLKAHPEAVAVRSNLGAALAHEGRYTDAIQEYKQALEKEPTNYGVRFNLALAYYKMSEAEQALKEFEAVYAIQPASDPEHRRLLLLLSECYLRRGEDTKVIALLDPLADADPNDLALAYLLGTALLHQGQDQRGALMIERILRNGDTAEAHMLMAFTRMKADDKKGATEEVDRAIALNPNLPEAYSLRGRLAYLAADLDGAEAAFRKALAVDPTAFDPLLWLGTLLREESKLPEARSRLEQANQLRPKEIRVRYQFALLCSDEGDDKRAAELLKALIKDAPEYTEAHRSLSTIDFRLGRLAEGRQERKIAEEMDAAIQAREQERGRKLRKCDQ
ncbi:MAG TPA: tetratricopeptide repeat protein [Candidatus Acidoferrum sp.]|nr:tetratricopeptide repeat protein [Candidatus Acidoferrum sp.]